MTDSAGWPLETVVARQRVIIDNDYCGDPDGLVQLAHHLLSPSVDIRLVIGGQVPTYDPSWSPACAEASVTAAHEIARLADRSGVRIVAGSSDAMGAPTTPRATAAAEAIVDEAMRDDSTDPLVVTCGGSLTNMASAWLMEPRIAERLTVVWIGGREHADLAEPPPGGLDVEYNTSIDLAAAQAVFASNLPLWQVPRDAYRQVVASRSEMLARMRPHGLLGQHLFESLGRVAEELRSWGMRLGETYILGDSPLVLLTALLSSFEAAPSSCRWVDRPRPHVLDSGRYDTSVEGPPIRIFTHLDSRLLLEDLYAKLALHAHTASDSPFRA